MTTRDTILAAALDRFARYGYLGSSIQQIADDVGTSKSSVLYHFATKEALLEAAMEPALEAIRELIDSLPQLHDDQLDAAPALVAGFVDTLMAHSAAVSIFVSQRGALHDVPAIRRGNALVDEIARTLVSEAPSHRDRARLSIGLAGIAFILSDDLDRADEHLEPEAARELFIETLLDLAAPAMRECAPEAVDA